MALAYDRDRKKHSYRDTHPLSQKAKRAIARRAKRQQANLKDDAFGKINWDAYQHRDLWNMIKSASPAEMGTRAQDWARLAVDVDNTTGQVQKSLQNLMLSWRGKSAVQAADSSSKLTSWAADASKTARTIGDGLGNYTTSVEQAQHKMPEPVHYYAERWFREGYDVSALDGPNGAYMMNQLLDDHLPTKKEMNKAKSEAVRVMNEYEDQSRGVQKKLPGFTAAPVVVPGGTDSAQASPAPSPSPSPGPQPGPQLPGPVHPGPNIQQPPAPVPLPGHDPDSTSAASFAPAASAGFGPGGMAGGFGPGSGGDLGGYGSGGVSGTGSGLGPGGSGAGPGGASVPGAGSSSGAMLPGGQFAGRAGAGELPGGAAGARGGAGAPGGGMYPPMGGNKGQGGEDGEHKNKYDLGLDLMDDLPPAYPPVFGQ